MTSVVHNAPLSPGLADLLESVPETAPIVTEESKYVADGVEFGAFRAAPADASAKHPGVLIISDWTGLGDHARVRAQLLARLGYVAIAGDLYGGGVQLEGHEAGPMAGRFYGDPGLFRERMQVNLDHILADPDVDPSRIAVMGYCFGGSGALELARSGAEVAGVIAFHSGLKTGMPAEPGAIRSPILVLTGAADPVVPDEDVIAFENELRAAGADDWQLHSYNDAMHAFTMPDANSPDHGAQFNPRANDRSWAQLQTFLGEVFA